MSYAPPRTGNVVFGTFDVTSEDPLKRAPPPFYP